MFSYVVALVTAGQIGQQIIRNIVLTVFEVLTPVINVLAIAMVIVGLLLAVGLRQEFYGIRLTISGLITLVFIHLILPILLTFI
ncbi:MAG: hypothetical protein ABDH63_00005 [Candidatus Caldarchaeales archaeon]